MKDNATFRDLVFFSLINTAYRHFNAQLQKPVYMLARTLMIVQ